MSVDPVEQYIATQPEPQQSMLRKAQAVVMSACPGATTRIAWGMPVFYYEGQLVGIAGFKKHISVFPMSGASLDFVGESITKYRTSKGTLQFPVGEKLPVTAIKQLVKFRMKENRAKAGK